MYTCAREVFRQHEDKTIIDVNMIVGNDRLHTSDSLFDCWSFGETWAWNKNSSRNKFKRSNWFMIWFQVHASAASPSLLRDFRRLAISIVVTAHSYPLFPAFPPALSIACKPSLKMTNPTWGTPCNCKASIIDIRPMQHCAPWLKNLDLYVFSIMSSTKRNFTSALFQACHRRLDSWSCLNP